jgi:hypothetical protein
MSAVYMSLSLKGRTLLGLQFNLQLSDVEVKRIRLLRVDLLLLYYSVAAAEGFVGRWFTRMTLMMLMDICVWGMMMMMLIVISLSLSLHSCE